MTKHSSFDFPLLFITFVLLGFGVVMVYSASALLAYERFGDSHYFLKKQLLWVLLSMIMVFAVAKVNYRAYRKIALPLFLISLFFLILLFFPHFSSKVSNVRRWLKIGFLNFQPSEAVKLALIIYIANSLVKKQEKIKSFVYGLLPHLIILGAIVFLILIQPDFGTAFTLAFVILVMLFIGGVKISHLIFLILSLIPFLYLLIYKVGYRKNRILAFLNPDSDPLGIGFHIKQSFLSLGSGGLVGKGIGGGVQKLLYLPEPHTDFIFAVIGEEMGFIGTVSIVILFLVFLVRGIKISSRADLFGKLLGSGITFMIVGQAFINMGVVTGILPTTGIPLPFISFGGSSLLFTMIGVGILLNISRQQLGEVSVRKG